MPEPYENRIWVRYAETDQMGVVYHANYLVYMEEARTRLMAAAGYPYHEFERTGQALVVRKADLRFRSPLFYGDEIRVLTWIEEIRGASVSFRYRIERTGDGTHIADGHTELACVNLTGDRKPTLLPRGIRDALAAYHAPQGRS